MAEVASPTGEPPDTSKRDPLETGSHDLPVSSELEAFICQGWADPEPLEVRALAPSDRCSKRRALLSSLVPGDRVVVPSGRAAKRGNGQDVRFRPASDHVYLTGQAAAGAVLVLEPDGSEHNATLYLDPPTSRDRREFFSDVARGELWVGARPSLAAVEEALGVECRPFGELEASLSPGVTTRVLRGLDEAVDSLVAVDDSFPDRELRAFLSELRLVKDEWEIRQIEDAVAATHAGFEDVVRELPGALGPGGERRIESVFLRRARLDGNDAAFNPIVAAGSHATTLHWTRNDGALTAGDLLLLDAGAESHTLYAADLTRTFPLSGSFSEVQRRALDLLNDAHEAALAAIAPGRSFRDFHHAAAEVVSAGLADWGVLPAGRNRRSGFYRRFTICGTGHMLGLDVHDCAHARAATYLDGELRAGHVLTVEPGLYFQQDDLTVPEELRGIGLRVEDDVVVTETGVRVLSDRLPRRPADLEIWMAGLHSE